ncbi:Sialic acid synthase [Orchesella cincta]|uniref:Sialic acid synthase n=1 Tax=Orchesella cincta TaxID=48709 RepID=A0A1D2MYU8_ORCCI|nr:Sialic acid synthase [Orchesella cincta]
MLTIRDVKIGGDSPCFIIAEIGQNHQGDVEIAKRMIEKAKECGVSCVKFQKSSLPDRFTQSALDAPYIGENSFGKTYGKHRAHLEFSHEEFKMLQEYAEQTVGIMFTASCMDISFVINVSHDAPTTIAVCGFLAQHWSAFHQRDTNNPLLIEHVAKLGLPIVLSTGMADFDTVCSAHKILKKNNSTFALLHCVSAYPTPPEDVNLAVIQLYKSRFPDVPMGYSGHEEGIVIAIAAVAFGAKIIEKHFTLDKTMKGTDHPCSLNPKEMKELVAGIRKVEAAVGKPIKSFLPSEVACNTKLGKTIVSRKDIEKGALISISDISIKVSRPPGLQPKYLKSILGCRATQKIPNDTPITKEDVDLDNSPMSQ